MNEPFNYSDYSVRGGAHTAQKKRPWWILIVAAVLIVAIVVIVLIFALPRAEEETESRGKNKKAEPQKETTPTAMTVQDVTPEVQKVPCPVDFKALQDQNADIYAWIQIPDELYSGTIDYPIAQSSPDEEEDFYLHRGVDKEYLFEGTIYTQKYNTKSFNDPNTIIYGHCMKDGSMFRALHDLKNESVWEAVKEFYIYTADGRKLTYEIFSAYTRDDRHILRENNYYLTEQDMKDYIEEVEGQAYSMSRDCNVTSNDRIVTLETCVTANGNTRFVVSGVLRKVEPTYYKAN